MDEHWTGIERGRPFLEAANERQKGLGAPERLLRQVHRDHMNGDAKRLFGQHVAIRLRPGHPHRLTLLKSKQASPAYRTAWLGPKVNKTIITTAIMKSRNSASGGVLAEFLSFLVCIKGFCSEKSHGRFDYQTFNRRYSPVHTHDHTWQAGC